MTTINEGIHNGEFLLSEGNGYISRDAIEIAAAAPAMPSGQLLGKITATGKYTVYASGAVDGTQTVAGVLYAAVPDAAVIQKATMIARFAEISANRVTGVLDATSKGHLAALNIIVR